MLRMDENQSLFELEVDHATSEELLDTSRWQRMFGILMISIIGLILLAFLIGWGKIAGLVEEAIAGEGGGDQEQQAFAFLRGHVARVAAARTDPTQRREPES